MEKSMNTKYVKKLSVAYDLAEKLSELDSEQLTIVAEYLVRTSTKKADSLEFALASEMREYLMGFGFSDKINREVA
jgi:hypothetical protein